MIEQLDTENADLDIQAAYVLCLTDTPSTVEAMRCQVLVLFGDGAKDLHTNAAVIKMKIDIGSQEGYEVSFTKIAADLRENIWSGAFPVPANTEVKVYVLSDNANDSDVDVTAYLYDMDPLGVTPDADVLTTLAASPRDWLLQTWRRFFKKTELDHTNLTMKSFKDDGTTAVTTQAVAESSTVETQGAAT